jgi:hypothetical protein
LNRPAGDLFPDLCLTDNAFSKDTNFFYKELNHQQTMRNPAKGIDANPIDIPLKQVTEKTIDGP